MFKDCYAKYLYKEYHSVFSRRNWTLPTPLSPANVPHRARIPSPIPLRVVKTGRNHLNEEITPLLPTGIGDRFKPNLINLGHAAPLRRCERKCWTNSGGPLVNSLLWGVPLPPEPKVLFLFLPPWGYEPLTFRMGGCIPLTKYCTAECSCRKYTHQSGSCWIQWSKWESWNISYYLCPGPLHRMYFLEAYYCGSNKAIASRVCTQGNSMYVYTPKE